MDFKTKKFNSSSPIENDHSEGDKGRENDAGVKRK